MGILGGLVSRLENETGLTQDQHERIATALLDHVQHHPSGQGLSGLLQGFQNSGMKQQVNSWIGNGQNESISPEQVQQGLGQNAIEQIAARAGVSSSLAKVAIAKILPLVVDHLTHNGQVPQGAGLSGVIGGLLRKTA